MITLKQSLERKKVCCVVETSTHCYVGDSLLLLEEISENELNLLVGDEYCTRIGNQRQWSIFTQNHVNKNNEMDKERGQ